MVVDAAGENSYCSSGRKWIPMMQLANEKYESIAGLMVQTLSSFSLNSGPT